MAGKRNYKKMPAEGNTPELGKTAGTAGKKAKAKRVMKKSATKKVK